MGRSRPDGLQALDDRSASTTSWSPPVRSTRRPCCNAPASGTHQQAARHPPHRQARRRGVPRRRQRPRRRPVHQVKGSPRLSFGGSASGSGLLALGLSDDWKRFGPAIETAVTSPLRGDHQRGPRHACAPCPAGVTRSSPTASPGTTGHCSARAWRLSLVMLEAGATACIRACGAPVVRRRSISPRSPAASVPGQPMTVHLCSTAPMGNHRAAATDSFGVLSGVGNVLVSDASLLPDAPGVNPQASVMAIATHATPAASSSDGTTAVNERRRAGPPGGCDRRARRPIAARATNARPTALAADQRYHDRRWRSRSATHADAARPISATRPTTHGAADQRTTDGEARPIGDAGDGSRPTSWPAPIGGADGRCHAESAGSPSGATTSIASISRAGRDALVGPSPSELR